MNALGWCKVSSVELTSEAKAHGAGAWYRFHVRGVNTETGERFEWSVPSLDWHGYDLSSVTVPALVVRAPRPSVCLSCGHAEAYGGTAGGCPCTAEDKQRAAQALASVAQGRAVL